MEQVSIIDLAKRSFSLHGARADGSVAFRRSLSRLKVLHFLEQQAKCIVEACGSSHYWGREIAKLGHEVRLLPPRQTLRQASEERRGGRGGDRRSRVPPDDAIRRREDRGTAVAWNGRHEACSCGSGPRRSTRFAVILRSSALWLRKALPTSGSLRMRCWRLPSCPILCIAADLLQQVDGLNGKIAEIDNRETTKEDEDSRLLMSMPGVGPMTASAIRAFAPPMENSGRDFAAWLGLTPREDSTGGKVRLGRITKMGQRDIRRASVPCRLFGGRSARAPTGSWLARMLATKPPKLVAVALANKMARTAWALLTKKERVPAVAPAAD